MAPIQFGWSLSSGPLTSKDFLTAVEQGVKLAEGKLDSLWVVDHLQFGNGPLLEGWTALTYLAALYPHLHVGHAVLCQSFRNPALLAKMGATLQYLSQGRFILGIGAGWKEDEYTAYGYPFPSAATRVEELDETLQIVKALWHDERATVQGKHYQVVDAWCEPKPDPVPPIMVGAFKPRMLRLAARYADWWNVSWTDITTYRQLLALCEEACQREGRDPGTLRKTWFGSCVCAPNEAQVEAFGGQQMRTRNAFVGTPAQVIEQMRPFVEAGITYFMLGTGGFPNLTSLKLFVEEVLPALNSL